MIAIVKTLAAGIYVVLVFFAVDLATRLLSFGQSSLEVSLKTVLFFLILFRVVDKSDFENFGRHIKSHGPFLTLYVLGTQVFWYLVLPALSALPWWLEQYQEYEKSLAALPLLTFQVLIAPLGEELIFRWLYVKTVEKMNAFNIVIVTLVGGMAFASVHPPAMWPFALMHGLFLMWYFSTYRDLLMTIVLHFAINLVNLIPLARDV